MGLWIRTKAWSDQSCQYVIQIFCHLQGPSWASCPDLLDIPDLVKPTVWKLFLKNIFYVIWISSSRFYDIAAETWEQDENRILLKVHWNTGVNKTPIINCKLWFSIHRFNLLNLLFTEFSHIYGVFSHFTGTPLLFSIFKYFSSNICIVSGTK